MKLKSKYGKYEVLYNRETGVVIVRHKHDDTVWVSMSGKKYDMVLRVDDVPVKNLKEIKKLMKIAKHIRKLLLNGIEIRWFEFDNK